MPACFQLYPKGSNEPVILQRLDDEMCRHFGVEPDPDRWLGGWYDTIGFRFALGKSFDQIREQFKEYVAEEKAKGNPNEGVEYYENLLLILDYIEERFTTTSFYSPFK